VIQGEIASYFSYSRYMCFPQDLIGRVRKAFLVDGEMGTRQLQALITRCAE
jgi:hypothetical protein